MGRICACVARSDHVVGLFKEMLVICQDGLIVSAEGRCQRKWIFPAGQSSVVWHGWVACGLGWFCCDVGSPFGRFDGVFHVSGGGQIFTCAGCELLNTIREHGCDVQWFVCNHFGDA